MTTPEDDVRPSLPHLCPVCFYEIEEYWYEEDSYYTNLFPRSTQWSCERGHGVVPVPRVLAWVAVVDGTVTIVGPPCCPIHVEEALDLFRDQTAADNYPPLGNTHG